MPQEKPEASQKKRSLAGRIFSVFLTLVTVLLLLLAILSFVSANEDTSLLGVRSYVVLSDSMVPTFSAGSLIIAYACPPENVKVGDIITYQLRSSKTLLTHRVTAVQTVAGQPQFTTRGDANNADDTLPVEPGQVKGKVFLWLGGVGRFISLLRNPLVLVAVLAVLFMIAFLPELVRKVRSRRT